jgi:PilZ domain
VFPFQTPRTERRLAARFNVKLPVRVRIPKSSAPEQWAESLNVSPRGICFATDLSLQKGSAVHVTFEMPEEVSKKPPSEWRSTGHVIHIQPSSSPQGAICVGVAFDCYEILPTTQTSVNDAQDGAHS